jgi:hypothetical protein
VKALDAGGAVIGSSAPVKPIDNKSAH